MTTFQKLIKKLNEKSIPYNFLKASGENFDVDSHVNELGIKYSEGMSTLIFRIKGDQYVSLLRRDDTNINQKELKRVLGTSRVSFASSEDLQTLGIEPGLACPLTLPCELSDKNSNIINRIYIDKKVTEMSRVICGSGSSIQPLEIKLNDLLKNIGEYEVIEVTEPNPKRQDKVSTVTVRGDDIETLTNKTLSTKRILTGDRPTGKLHIGHLKGSLENRVKLQHEYETFILIANIHALSDNRDNPEKVKNSIMELLCDYYAVGIDFDKTTVYIQSEVPEVHEIFMYLSNFTSIQQLMHNPTLKTEISQNKMDTSTPLGFFVYPIHQSADILCVNADLVPVGKDQAPMIEDTRELARKFNSTYGVNVLNEPKALFGVEKNIPGTDGNVKMGKSLGNTINLGDSEEELRKKVFSVYTDPTRIRSTDPGHIEGNVAFAYHDLFNENKVEVEDLKSRYIKGLVGDVEVKQKLFEAMNKVLTPIRERRIKAESIKSELLIKAIEGSQKVRKIAREIADQMKESMLIKF